jgi:hypothetical protein
MSEKNQPVLAVDRNKPELIKTTFNPPYPIGRTACDQSGEIA